MEYINFSIKKDLIYLKFGINENIFNNGLIYFQDLDVCKNFFHIKDITNIQNIKNYIIFVNKFRDNLDILEHLKTKYKLIAINLSFECFWIFLKLDKRCEEKIIYDNSSFNIKLKLRLYSDYNTQINKKIKNPKNPEIDTQKKFILENIDTLEFDINQYKEKILNESIEKLKIEYDIIKKNIEKLNIRIKNLDNYTLKLNDNNQLKIEQIYKKETLLEEIRELKSKKEEYVKLIKNNHNIFENMKKKKIEEEKLQENIHKNKLKLFQVEEEKLQENIFKYKLDEKKLQENIKKYKLDEDRLQENIKKYKLDEDRLQEKLQEKIQENIKKYKLDKDRLQEKLQEKLQENIKKYKLDEDRLQENIKKYELKLFYLKNEMNLKDKLEENIQINKEKLFQLKNNIYFKEKLEEKLEEKLKDLKKIKKVGILVHLFNINLWDEIYSYILNLKIFDIDVDLYINIAINNENELLDKDYIILKKNIEKIKWLNKVTLTNSDNRGMDSGGFLISYLKVLESNIDYDFIIKIHSKTNNNWRNLLLYSLLGSDKIIQNNFNLIKNPDIGMIGYQTMSLDKNFVINKKSYKFMDEYLNLLKIKEINNGFFIPGTIFIIKNYILKEYLTKEIILKIYKNFKPNYCGLTNNKLEERPHALERLYGLMVYNMKLKVISSNDKN
tara:strand:- start:7483 stop:9489 length:2007 start_codon:yes stop_codon:yes gene_type:complete